MGGTDSGTYLFYLQCSTFIPHLPATCNDTTPVGGVSLCAAHSVVWSVVQWVLWLSFSFRSGLSGAVAGKPSRGCLTSSLNGADLPQKTTLHLLMCSLTTTPRSDIDTHMTRKRWSWLMVDNTGVRCLLKSQVEGKNSDQLSSEWGLDDFWGHMLCICIIRSSVRVSSLLFLSSMSECVCVCVCECEFPAAPSLSVCTRHPPLFHLVYLFYLLAHSLSHSLTSCMSPFMSFFLSCIFLSSVPSSYSFEAYFLLCCRMWGGGGAWGKERVGESDSLNHMI